MNINLKHTFLSLVSKYNDNKTLHQKLWAEIELNHSHKKRHYHTLTHLQNLVNELFIIKSSIQDWDTLLFSIFYHDIVYNVKSQKNEEKSAELAQKILLSIGYPKDKIEVCFKQIIATKTHEINANNDTNLFTDADLSILGSKWGTYLNYTKQIRQEYSIYPDILYKPGRKKVINHFLEMTNIYKTEFFSDKYEGQARKNLRQERDCF